MPSQAYNEAVGARQRQTSAKVIFSIVDNTAPSDASITLSDEQTNISRDNELINNIQIEDTNKKWTTLEAGYFTLDGKNKITPKQTDTVSVDVGYWSEQLSNNSGEFETPIIITLQSSNLHSSIGFTLLFDNEYAKVFDMSFYRNDELILEENVTNNYSSIYVLNEPIDNYNKVVLTFYATKNPNRRLRLYEVTFGVVKTFTDTELIDLNITRELNIIDEVLPASDLDFSIDNLDKRFNFLNPVGLYKYLQTKQLIRSFIGVYINENDVEYMNTGQYYLDEWETDGITASFTAKDILYFIPDDLTYTVSSNTTKTLTEWLVTLLELANITNYEIDSSLDSISVITKFDETGVKSLIKSACTAGNCIIYVDTNNIVKITKIATNVANSILLNNMYNYPKVKLDTAYNTAKVGVYSASSQKVTSYVSVNNITNNEPVVEYSVSDNPFIINSTIATNVANYYLSLLSRRELYNIDWRQNPALDINDIVAVEDNFDVNGNVIITKQEYNYAGYLKGTTEGRGINVVANS